MVESNAIESIYGNICAGLEIVIANQKRQLGKFACFRKTGIVGEASDTVNTGPEAVGPNCSIQIFDILLLQTQKHL
jgi:hypothetical protein